MQLSRRQACSTLGALLALPAFLSLTRASAALTRVEDVAEFMHAVQAGKLERVRSLLAGNAALARATDGSKRSAFLIAHLYGHMEIAELLHKTGLELDLVEAVVAGDWDRFEALAEQSPAALNQLHPVGGTPLYAAALTGCGSNWRLRSVGCQPDAIPAGGSGYTAARGAMEATHANWARIAVTDLCSNGADINAVQRNRSSILHGAVQRQNEMLVRLAIRKGAQVEAVDAEGRTPLKLATALDWKEGEMLLRTHADLPRDNRSSRFALDANREPITRPDLSDVPQEMQSQITGSSHVRFARLKELVGTESRLVFSISSDDELAIEASAHIGSRDIIRYHLDHGAPLSLPTAVSLGDTESVKFWLERDPTLRNERGAHDFPVMAFAVLGGGSVPMAELLHSKGVPVDQESMGTTALHWCVKRGDHDLAKWLLEQGLDPELTGYAWNREGETPLVLAEAADDAKMTKLLKDAGARI